MEPIRDDKIQFTLCRLVRTSPKTFPSCLRPNTQGMSCVALHQWGAPSPDIGPKTYYLVRLLPKTAWKCEKLDWEGATLVRPLDPPMTRDTLTGYVSRCDSPETLSGLLSSMEHGHWMIRESMIDTDKEGASTLNKSEREGKNVLWSLLPLDANSKLKFQEFHGKPYVQCCHSELISLLMVLVSVDYVSTFIHQNIDLQAISLPLCVNQPYTQCVTNPWWSLKL